MHAHTHKLDVDILLIQMQCRSIAYRTCIDLLASHVDACRVHAGSVKTDVLVSIHPYMHTHLRVISDGEELFTNSHKERRTVRIVKTNVYRHILMDECMRLLEAR